MKSLQVLIGMGILSTLSLGCGGKSATQSSSPSVGVLPKPGSLIPGPRRIGQDGDQIPQESIGAVVDASVFFKIEPKMFYTSHSENIYQDSQINCSSQEKSIHVILKNEGAFTYIYEKKSVVGGYKIAIHPQTRARLKVCKDDSDDAVETIVVRKMNLPKSFTDLQRAYDAVGVNTTYINYSGDLGVTLEQGDSQYYSIKTSNYEKVNQTPRFLSLSSETETTKINLNKKTIMTQSTRTRDDSGYNFDLSKITKDLKSVRYCDSTGCTNEQDLSLITIPAPVQN